MIYHGLEWRKKGDISIRLKLDHYFSVETYRKNTIGLRLLFYINIAKLIIYII